MRKLWLLSLALAASALSQAQTYVRDNLFNYNLPTSTINVRDIALYKDKRLLIAGEFHAYSSVLGLSKVLRLTPQGAPDPTFTVPTIAGGRVNCVAIQPWDSSIVIAGGFSSVNGVARSGIARLLPSGALDASFNPGSGISGGWAGDLIILSVVIRTSTDPLKRRIIAGGLFTYYNGTAIAGGTGGGLVQLRTDGSLDAATSPRVEGAVYHLALDENNKLLAGGEFYRVNGNEVWRFARFNADGSTDNTLWTGRWDGFNSTVTSVHVYKGKIYVGGFFTQYRGSNSGRLARLNADGSYDATFNVGTGFTGIGSVLCTQGVEVHSLAFMSNDKVIVGGNFTACQGNSVNRIARLNSDGSYDASCITGTGFDQCVTKLVYQGTDDSLVVGGFFNSFRDEAQGTVIRIRKPPTPSLLSLGPAEGPHGAANGASIEGAYPNPFTVQLRVRLPGHADGPVEVSWTGMDGRETLRTRAQLRRGTVELRPAGLAAGTWLLRISDVAGKPLLQRLLVKNGG